MRKLNSPSGFTLVEMMVVAALISVLSIGFASYMYQQNRQLNSSKNRESINQLQLNILRSSGKEDVLQQTENLQK